MVRQSVGGPGMRSARSPAMKAWLPILVVSRNERTQDEYVAALRHERVPALGVSTCGAVVEMERHLRLGAVVLDVIGDEDWQACRLLRRALSERVPLLVLSERVADDGRFRSLARNIGCAAFVARSCRPPAVLTTLDRIAQGERWIECVGVRR